MHLGGHRSKKAHENQHIHKPAKGKTGLAKVKTGGSIYVQMRKVMKAIIICNDSESDKEQEQESKQQPNHNHRVVEADEDDEDEDEDDQEDDYTPYISRETVDGYLVSNIEHLEEYS